MVARRLSLRYAAKGFITGNQFIRRWLEGKCVLTDVFTLVGCVRAPIVLRVIRQEYQPAYRSAMPTNKQWRLICPCIHHRYYHDLVAMLSKDDPLSQRNANEWLVFHVPQYLRANREEQKQIWASSLATAREKLQQQQEAGPCHRSIDLLPCECKWEIDTSCDPSAQVGRFGLNKEFLNDGIKTKKFAVQHEFLEAESPCQPTAQPKLDYKMGPKGLLPVPTVRTLCPNCGCRYVREFDCIHTKEEPYCDGPLWKTAHMRPAPKVAVAPDPLPWQFPLTKGDCAHWEMQEMLASDPKGEWWTFDPENNSGSSY